MKNNKGIGKYELLTMIVIGSIVVCLVLWYFIGVANRERYTTLRKSAASLSQTVTANINSFHNTDVAYLGEAIRDGYVAAISSPFSGKNCSPSESKVEMKNAKALVTLRCDNYLIDKTHISGDYESIPIYKVSDWTEEKPKGKSEKRVLYNCLDGGKEKYPEYVEELYFVSLINNDYGSNHYGANTIKNECVVVNKTFYRTKTRIK
jgi:hypothetical protein